MKLSSIQKNTWKRANYFSLSNMCKRVLTKAGCGARELAFEVRDQASSAKDTSTCGRCMQCHDFKYADWANRAG